MRADALVVMLRSPEPGAVKTRLCPPLAPDEAVGLYKALVKDTFRNISLVDNADLFAAVTQPLSSKTIADIIPHKVAVTIQEGDDLGERLYNIFKSLFLRKYSRIAVIGSDSPDLPTAYIDDAFSRLRLNQGSVVLGPALDGGYYLIGMDSLRKEPFEGVAWGTASVLSETLSTLESAKIDTTLLNAWYDIDLPQDLFKLSSNPATPACENFLKERRVLERMAKGRRSRLFV
jgi:hypothetical protein